jgi:mannose-6-phosphate isomerase class I
LGWSEDELVGPGHTPCFTLTRHTVTTSCTIPLEKRLHIGVVTAGSGSICAGDHVIVVRPGSRLLIPAHTQGISVTMDGSPLNLVWCHEE